MVAPVVERAEAALAVVELALLEAAPPPSFLSGQPVSKSEANSAANNVFIAALLPRLQFRGVPSGGGAGSGTGSGASGGS